jgi:hypothetical protein
MHHVVSRWPCSSLHHRQSMSLSTELGLNGLHGDQRTPQPDDLFIVSRGDQFKLVLGFAL